MRLTGYWPLDQRALEWQLKQMDAQATAAQQPPLVRSGGRAGVMIDGVVYPLGGEPPTATTKGWGVVPGDPDAPRRAT